MSATRQETSRATMTTPIDRNQRRARLAALLVLALAACGNDPVLRSVAIGTGTGKVFVAVGETQQLTLMGTFSNGQTAPLGGVTWTSSDPAVASMEQTGLVVPWAKGTAQITATHGPSGLSAIGALTSRVVITVPATALPFTGAVDTTDACFHVTGLTPGAMYTPTLSGMSDDVDMYSYTDLSLESLACDSDYVGLIPDSCTALADASGGLWVVADGQWTTAGATFALDAPAAQPVTLAGTLAYPAGFPYAGSVGATRQYYGVAGLTPSARYEVKISNLTADIDVAVYDDLYRYRLLCESIELGTADDFCTASSGAAGELVIEVDGQTTLSGGPFTLAVTPVTQ
jgi:hypothetical protein